MYKWADVYWSQRVSLTDSMWFVCIFCSFMMTVTEPGWLLFQSLQWEGEWMKGRRVKARNCSLQITWQQRNFCEKQWTDRSNLRDYGKSLPTKKRRQCLLQPRKVMSWLKMSQKIGCPCKDAVNGERLLIMLFVVLNSYFNISLI